MKYIKNKPKIDNSIFVIIKCHRSSGSSRPCLLSSTMPWPAAPAMKAVAGTWIQSPKLSVVLPCTLNPKPRTPNPKP